MYLPPFAMWILHVQWWQSDHEFRGRLLMKGATGGGATSNANIVLNGGFIQAAPNQGAQRTSGVRSMPKVLSTPLGQILSAARL